MRSFSEKIMSSDPNVNLESFVARFFSSQGADVEKRGGSLDVLSPPELARRIGIPEFCNLRVGDAGGEGHAVHYGSPLLEKIAEAACETVPLALVNLSFHYIKSEGFGRLMAESFTLNGALARVETTAAQRAEYLLLVCRYLAQSDEQKEGLLPLAFNLETGAPVGNLEALLTTADKRFEPAGSIAAFGGEKVRKIIRWARGRAADLLADEIEPFRESMNRRFRRDVANLEAYYAELKREMTESLGRSGLSEQLIRERKEKIALIPDEMAKKREDLFNKYSIRVKLELSGAMLIRTPAVNLRCMATVGRRKRPFSLLYNPIDKSLDPLVCAGCGQGTYQVHFCDNLHLLCPRCAMRCPVCATAS
jgi:hypothetical protein